MSSQWLLTFQKTSPEMAEKLGWVSLEKNEFKKPGQWVSASGDQAYGNTHADSWFMRECGHAIAVNPEGALVKEAEARGWEQVQWRVD